VDRDFSNRLHVRHSNAIDLSKIIGLFIRPNLNPDQFLA
jgi:hypothetical protein